MREVLDIAVNVPKRIPWNKGKVTGAKRPLRPNQVWTIRTKLEVEGRIDSKLRGCDVMALKVEDVAQMDTPSNEQP